MLLCCLSSCRKGERAQQQQKRRNSQTQRTCYKLDGTWRESNKLNEKWGNRGGERKCVKLKQGNANERRQKLLWPSWHHTVNSWVEQSAAVSCHWLKMKAMWLGVEYSTSVNFREPTPASRRAWRQPLLACLNLRGEAGKLDIWSLDRPTCQCKKKKGLCKPLIYIQVFGGIVFLNIHW